MLILPSASAAQGDARAFASFQSFNVTLATCGNNVPSSSTALSSCIPFTNIAGGLVAATSFASAINGQLRASSSIGASAFSSPNLVGDSYAQVRWVDRLTFGPLNGASPAFVDFLFRVTGTESLVASNGHNLGGPDHSSVATQPTISVSVGDLHRRFDPSGLGAATTTLGGVASDGDGTYIPSQNYNLLVDLHVLFDSDIDLSFLMALDDHLAVQNGTGGLFTGGSATDFSHTVDLASYVVTDANGDDITNQLSASFENGLLMDSATTTPEPATMTLMATGLLGVIAFRRRRQTV